MSVGELGSWSGQLRGGVLELGGEKENNFVLFLQEERKALVCKGMSLLETSCPVQFC